MSYNDDARDAAALDRYERTTLPNAEIVVTSDGIFTLDGKAMTAADLIELLKANGIETRVKMGDADVYRIVDGKAETVRVSNCTIIRYG